MKYLLLAALLFVSAPAMAEDMPPAGHDEMPFEQRKAEMMKHMGEKQACMQAAATSEAMEECMKKNRGGNFEERKAEAIKHMGERIAEMQKNLVCVQAAADHDAMKACMPPRKGGRKMGGHDDGGPEGN